MGNEKEVKNSKKVNNLGESKFAQFDLNEKELKNSKKVNNLEETKECKSSLGSGDFLEDGSEKTRLIKLKVRRQFQKDMIEKLKNMIESLENEEDRNET